LENTNHLEISIIESQLIKRIIECIYLMSWEEDPEPSRETGQQYTLAFESVMETSIE
jgi:hypothetical protein